LKKEVTRDRKSGQTPTHGFTIRGASPMGTKHFYTREERGQSIRTACRDSTANLSTLLSRRVRAKRPE